MDKIETKKALAEYKKSLPLGFNPIELKLKGRLICFIHCSAKACVVVAYLQLKLEAIDKRIKLEAIDKRIKLEAIDKRIRLEAIDKRIKVGQSGGPTWDRSEAGNGYQELKVKTSGERERRMPEGLPSFLFW